jgi:lysophospholipase L1-like esterase
MYDKFGGCKMEKRLPVIGAQPIKLSEDNGKYLRTYGRYTIKQECLAFDWSNSGFSFNFSGTGFILSLGSYSADQPAYVKVYLDGSEQRFAISTGTEKIIYENLPDKRHRVTVLRVTEGAAPLLFKELVLFGKDQKFMSPPFDKPRRIEFIGDSVTSGYGVIADPSETTYQTYQQDSTMTYAYFTAKELEADAHYICISGKGIVCDCNGEKEEDIPRFFEYASREKEPWDFSKWIPGVVVVNAGTNDVAGAIGDREFTEKSVEFLNSIRSKYPEAHIVWVYGMMNDKYVSAIKEAIKELNKTDKKVHFLYVESINQLPGETGANGHPNTRANMRVSKLLVKKIRSVTGWK